MSGEEQSQTGCKTQTVQTIDVGWFLSVTSLKSIFLRICPAHSTNHEQPGRWGGKRNLLLLDVQRGDLDRRIELYVLKVMLCTPHQIMSNVLEMPDTPIRVSNAEVIHWSSWATLYTCSINFEGKRPRKLLMKLKKEREQKIGSEGCVKWSLHALQ